MVVLFLSLNNLQAWLIDVGFSSHVFFIKKLLIPWYALITPMFFLFLIHYFKIEKHFIIRLKQIIFFFFFEVVLRVILICYLIYLKKDNENNLIEYYNQVEEVINAIISFLFLAVSIQIVFFKTELHNQIKTFDNVGWLKVFLMLGLMVMSFWIFSISVNFYIKNDWANYPLRLATSILLYWIGYQGMYKYDLLRDRIGIRSSIKKMKSNSKSNLSNKQNTDFENINSHILNNESYLNPNFGLNTLAEELNLSSSHISKIINANNPYNFSDYINNFRIKHAKQLLENCDFNNYTIVAIGLECGFNSKSAFYTAFKKFTSQTPSEFRQQFNC